MEKLSGPHHLASKARRDGVDFPARAALLRLMATESMPLGNSGKLDASRQPRANWFGKSLTKRILKAFALSGVLPHRHWSMEISCWFVRVGNRGISSP